VGLGSPESKIRSAYLLSSASLKCRCKAFHCLPTEWHRKLKGVNKFIFSSLRCIYNACDSMERMQYLESRGVRTTLPNVTCFSQAGSHHPFSGAMAAHWCQESISGSIATGTVDMSGGVVVGEAASVVRG
jgi:hypothetical protein